MATYKNINGTNIPIRASDPSNPILGEIWYNSTSNTLKGQGYAAAVWSTGGTVNNAMANGGMTTQGTQTAFLIWAGAAPGVDANPGYTESYNGTSWTNLSTTPYPATGVLSFGTQTAAVGAGGNDGGGGKSTTIEWNGSSWGSGGALPFLRMYHYNGAGTATDGISIGGWNQSHPTGGSRDDVIVYDGSTWSTDPATCPFPAYSGTLYGSSGNDTNYLGGWNPSAPESRIMSMSIIMEHLLQL